MINVLLTDRRFLCSVPRVFYGEAAGAQKEKGTASVVYAVLGKFPDPSVWLDHYSAEKRTFEFCIDKTRDH